MSLHTSANGRARQATIEKIRKLQARALRGGSAEEAASAARKAHELKTTHHIADHELLEPAVTPARSAAGTVGRTRGPAAPSLPRPPALDVVLERAAGAFVNELLRGFGVRG